MARSFTGNEDGPSIEETLQYCNKNCRFPWRTYLPLYLEGKPFKWWQLLNHDKLKELSDENFEQFFLDRWPHA